MKLRLIQTAFVLLLSLSLSCGSGLNRKGASHELNFIAVKGAVHGGTITVFTVDSTGNEGIVLATGTTESGLLTTHFSPNGKGALGAKVAGGTYTDEATGQTVSLGDFTMSTLLSELPKSGSTIYISALTEMAAQYARSLLASGQSITAIETANTAVAKMAGLTDIVLAPKPNADPTKKPDDPTSETAKYGLVLAGLSQQADTLGVKPTNLVKAFGDDIKDGKLDGVNGTAAVTVEGGSTLQNDAFTNQLTAGMDKYVNNNTNNPGFTIDSKPVTYTSETVAQAVNHVTITDITSTTTSGTIRASDSISLSVTFTGDVTVTGTPKIKLNSGGSAVYASGSGTNTLTFTYTVQPGENISRLDSDTKGAFTLLGGKIQDSAGIDATLVLPTLSDTHSLKSNTNLVVDTVPTAPTSLTATNGDAVVPLSWTAPVGYFGTVTYNIYRGSTSGGETLLASGVSGTSYNDTAVTNDSSYYYVVKSVAPGGTSSASNEVNPSPYHPTFTSITFVVKSGSLDRLFNNGSSTTILRATTLDQRGIAFAGRSVTVTIPSNGGTIGTNPATSNSLGIADFTLTSSTTKGTYVYTASSGGINSSGLSVIFDPCAEDYLTNTPFATGKGSASQPYWICTRAQFNTIATNSAYTTRYFVLAQSISMSSGITSVGNSSYPFRGSFDGQNYTLSDVSLTGSANNVGLFSYVSGGKIKNLNVTASSVSASAYNNVGVLVGYATGAVYIRNVAVTLTGALSGAQNVGGVVGYLDTSADTVITKTNISGGGSVTGSSGYVGGFTGRFAAGNISNAYSTLSTTSTYNNTSAFVGGFAGSNAGTIGSSYSTGTVTNSTANAGRVGGFVGDNSGTITYRSYSSSTVSASGSTSQDIGGLVGYNSGTITQSYSTGAVTAKSAVGGLVGNHNSGTISTSYSTSTVSGGGNNVGGLIGYSNSTVNDCYSTGNATSSSSSNLGGAIGNIASGTVSRIFSIGAPSGSSITNLGGLVGSNSGTLASGFWDTTTSSQGSSAAGTGLPTAGMKSVPNYASQCWDFGTVWQKSNSTGYPIFQWQSAQTLPTLASLFAGGAGTSASPYQVSTAAQLANIAHAIQLPSGQRAHYKLTTTVNLTGADAPSPIIGCSTYPFKGTFDGFSNEIQNYTVTGALNNVGLFGYIQDATIKDLTVSASTVSSSSYDNVGAVIGYGTGNLALSNITLNLSGTVSGNSAVGGFAGYLDTSATSQIQSITVANSGSGSVSPAGDYAGGMVGRLTHGSIGYSSSAISLSTTNNSGSANDGGLVGYMVNGTIYKSSSTGSVTNSANGPGHIGGLVGAMDNGTISASYSTGAVSTSGTSSAQVGGLVGIMNNSSMINKKSYSTSNVTAGGNGIGGLVGYISGGTVSDTYATGTIQGSSQVGGLVGEVTNSSPVIRRSYSTSNVTGETNVGGLIGAVTGNNNTSDCYAQGSVTANSGNLAGGSIGGFTSGTINRVYSTGAVSGTSTNKSGGVAQIPNTTSQGGSWLWDTTTSGQATSAGGRGLATALMKAQSTFVNEGWDFTDVWQIPTATGYPIFQWQANQTPIDIGTLFAGGDGSISSPYLITTATHLQNLANAVQIDYGARFSYYKLTGNIDLTGLPMPVIGTSTYPFSGVFDGFTNQIQNYSVTANSNYVGLFGYVDGGTIQNLTVTVSAIDGSTFNYVGGVVGYATGVTTLSKVYVDLTGTLRGTQYVGGLAGQLDTSTGTIVSECNVTGAGNVAGYTSGPGTSQYVGGLIGSMGYGDVDKSYASIPVSTSRNYLGGLIGANGGIVTASYATGAVSTTQSSASRIGGLVGSNSGLLNLKCYATGNVTATQSSSERVGGLVGYSTGSIYMSYATGAVSSISYVGGLVGENQGTINQSYSTSNATGTTDVGGLVGINYTGTVSDSYATGTVTLNASGSNAGGSVGDLSSGTFTRVFSYGLVTGAGTTNKGGFAGTVTAANNRINGVFWDATTGYATSSGTSGYKSSYTGSTFGLATADLQTYSTFVAATYDFFSVWQLPTGGSQYPKLQWQLAQTPITIDTLFAGGAGTEASPYQISTAVQLQNLAYAVQLGDTGRKAHYILTANIDLDGYVSPIIGTSTYPFSGTFDGKSYSISNYQTTAVDNNTGLFGYVNGGTIKNFTLNGVAINGQAYNSVGTVVGYADSLDMANVTVAFTNTITGQDNIGGLIGKVDGSGVSINLCSVTGSGSGAVSPLGNSIGGLIGYFNGTGNQIKSSYSAIPVSASGRSYVGGVVGYLNYATVQTCYSTGNVTGGSNTGGVAGLNQGYIKNSYSSSVISGSSSVGGVAGQDGNDYNPDGYIYYSYATGTVTGTSEHVGGLVGLHWNGAVTDSYATGNVSGSNNVGGLVGYNRANVTDAYAQGTVTATGDRLGGAVGHMEGGTHTRVYATGALSGTVTYKGGFLGYRQSGSFSNCFWDTQSTGNGSAAGNAATLSGISGQNTAAMKDATIFTNASWDFTDKWQIPAVANYPVFKWQSSNLTNAIAALFNGGTGVLGDPYQVDTEAQLSAMTTALQNSVAAQSAYYKLTSNITISGASPIIGTSTYPFSGVFDGNNKSISGYTVTGSAHNIGLFGYVGAGAVIKNLTLNAGAIDGTGYNYVGSVVGRAVGAITLSKITVDLTGTLAGVSYVGGIIGSFVSGDMIDCVIATSGGGSVAATGTYVGGIAGEMTTGGMLVSHSSIPVSSTSGSTSAYVGGAIGYCGSASAYGAVVSSYSTGSVTDNANSAGQIGGLIGANQNCVVSLSRATGTVSATGTSAISIGGLVGNLSDGSVRMSYSSSTITATNAQRVGGLVGYQSGGAISKSYASGAVTGHSYVGGLVGRSNSTITDAYAMGDVTSAGDVAGGAIGQISGGTVSYVYARGNLLGGGTNQGGFTATSTSTTYGCNWDTTTSNTSSSDSGLGQSTANMQLMKTFVNQGWNFGTTWVMSTGTNYPIFQWQQANTFTTISTYFNGGTGTPASPFQINTAAQLQNLAIAIQQSTIAQTASYVLTANINVNATTKPIIGSAAYPFMGDFNGQGYSITNYSLEGNNDYQALFGYVQNATIRNFSMTVSTISASVYNYIGSVVGYALNSDIIDVAVTLSGAVDGLGRVGALAGYMENTSTSISTSVKNCHVSNGGSGSVSASGLYAGGLIGSFNGTKATLAESYSVIPVTSTSTGGRAGGLVGSVTSSIVTNCYSTGTVTDTESGAVYIGGLVGENSGTITGLSYSTSTVTASTTNSEYVGGLVGTNTGYIYKSYATGAVTGYQKVGGVAGYNSGTMGQTYSTSNITGTLRVGGLVGETGGTVSDSYAKGSVTANNGNYVGGAVGLYSSGTISRFYSKGAVSGTSATNKGGLVGANTTSGPTFGGLWDSDTSGISTNTGSGCSVPNYCGVPYSDTFMKEKITYTNNGYDFFTTWVMPTGGANYPILQWQQPNTPTELGVLFAGGDGSSSSPFQISTAAQLENFAYAVTTGTTGQNAHYALTANINVSGLQMPVIGTSAKPFSGFFNGGGYTISNYTVIGTEHYTGLFGYVSNATIKNFTLNVTSLDANSYNYVGSVVGYASGATLISDVTVNLSGNLKGDQYVGGFAGHLDLSSSGLVKNCHVVNASSAAVSGNYRIGGFAGKLTTGHITYSDAGVATSSTTNAAVYLGGFVGENSSGTISHSYSTGNVTDNSNSVERVGGLVGENSGTISDRCYSTSTVSATGTSLFVGGLVGVNSGTVTIAYATGSVSGYDYAGGVFGYNSGTVSLVYGSGAVSGHNYTGGIAGQMASGTMTDCYATGAVSNTSGTDSGGGIGSMGGGTVKRIYSTGAVSGAGTIGGLVGNGSSGFVYNSLWDTTTSGQATSARGNGFATAVLQKTSVYASRHWNFKTTWNYVSGSSYPTFQWQETVAVPSLSGLFDSGDGTKTSPFAIATAEQLNNMPYAVQVYTDAQTAYYVLTADINLSGLVSPVIGMNDGSVSYPFKGFFDGQDHTISNYTITTNADYVGLFGYVDGATLQSFDLTVSSITGTAAGSNTGTANIGGVIGYGVGLLYAYDINVTLNGTVSGYNNVAGFAGNLNPSAHTLIDSCSVLNGGSGAISATRDYIGGFTGYFATGQILNSSSAVSVTSTYANADVYVGGFAGKNLGTLSSCYSTGATTDNQSSAHYVGGLVGGNSGTINNQSYSSSTVSATGSNTNYTGGLAGLNGGTITQSYATGAVSGYNYVGGLVGHQNGGSLTQSYATGAVTGTGSYHGGLTGIANTNISDCYAKGAVSSSGSNYAGGAIGFINNGITVSRIYSTGAVSGSSSDKGGLVGNYSGTGTVSNGFWDTTTSGTGSSALGTGNNTTAMQTSTTYTGASWTVDSAVVPLGTPDPDYTWKFSASSGVYPSLGWQ